MYLCTFRTFFFPGLLPGAPFVVTAGPLTFHCFSAFWVNFWAFWAIYPFTIYTRTLPKWGQKGPTYIKWWFFWYSQANFCGQSDRKRLQTSVFVVSNNFEPFTGLKTAKNWPKKCRNFDFGFRSGPFWPLKSVKGLSSVMWRAADKLLSTLIQFPHVA